MKSIGEVLRTGAQRAGISDSRINWGSLPPHRKERWNEVAEGLKEEGYTVDPSVSKHSPIGV